MASSLVKVEDRLVGVANFNAWKYRIINILEENDLEDFISREIEEPTTNTVRAAYKRKQTKDKRIIFYYIKDNMMPIISHLRTAKDCFDALENLYEKKTPTQKRILKKQLRTLKMGNNDTVVTFFSKIVQTRDQLIAIGVPVDDDDLVQTAFDGLPDAWGVFLASVNGRESQPNFERLWHDCLEGGGRLNNINDYPILKDHALAAKTKKWRKFPKSKGKGKKPQGKLSHLNPHLSKVKCFNYNKLGHYAKDCRSPPLSRKEEEDFKPQLPLKRLNPKRSLKEDKPGLPPKSKKNIRNIISSLLFPALSPNQRRFG
jgi:hypothetical protein